MVMSRADKTEIGESVTLLSELKVTYFTIFLFYLL